MSCLVTGDDVLNRLERNLRTLVHGSHLIGEYDAQKLQLMIAEFQEVEDLYWDSKRLLRLFYLMNIKAYRERFKHRSDSRFYYCKWTYQSLDLPKIGYTDDEAILNLVADTLKQLEFLHYQIADMSLDDMATYEKPINFLRNELLPFFRQLFVEVSPAYRKAKWGE